MQSLIVFNSKDVRGEVADNEPWFALMDVCQILGIRDVKQAGERLKDKYKRNILLSNKGRGKQSVVCINKIGCYRLIMRSNSPAAEAFQDEIYDYVIPEYIDKGGVINPRATAEQLEQLQHHLDYQKKISAQMQEHCSVLISSCQQYTVYDYCTHEKKLRLTPSQIQQIDYIALDISSKENIPHPTAITPNAQPVMLFRVHVLDRAIELWKANYQ